MEKYNNRPVLFEINELPGNVRNFALHSFIEKSKAVHTITINRSRQRNIHEVVNDKYALNGHKNTVKMVQRCTGDLNYCYKLIEANLCLFTLQGVYVPFMFNV